MGSGAYSLCPDRMDQIQQPKQPKQIGHYRILREVGRGGMGVVYEAEHRDFKSRVAIKVLHPRLAEDPQIVARFRLEAIAANVPQHPGIAQVLGGNVLSETDGGGLPYIVMEFLDGKPLRRRLSRRKGGLPEPMVVRFGKQIADALTAAHAKKVVHRDIKPENIMIVRDDAVPGGERAKVLDFGIAAVAAELFATESQSDTQINTSPFGGMLGTAAYMAPEQCQRAGKAPIDDRVDVYALGAVLYEMLTGAPPFVAPESVSVLYKHLHQPPEPVRKLRPQVTPELDELVLRMLAKAPERRPSMREVALLLGQFAEPSAQSLPLVPAYTGRRWRWLQLSLLSVMALLLLGFGLRRLLTGASSVAWHVSSQPSGAEVVGPDGTVLGKTPWHERRTRDLGKFPLELRYPGHQSAYIVLDRSEDFDQVIPLPRSP